MNDNPFNNLSPLMKARLEKWRENVKSVTTSQKTKSLWLSKCRPVRRDHGDDISDFKQKHEEAFKKPEADK